MNALHLVQRLLDNEELDPAEFAQGAIGFGAIMTMRPMDREGGHRYYAGIDSTPGIVNINVRDNRGSGHVHIRIGYVSSMAIGDANWEADLLITNGSMRAAVVRALKEWIDNLRSELESFGSAGVDYASLKRAKRIVEREYDKLAAKLQSYGAFERI